MPEDSAAPTDGYAVVSAPNEKVVPLALSFGNDAPAWERDVLSVGWTAEGFAALRDLRDALGGPDKRRMLPHRALTALCELYVPALTRLVSDAFLTRRSVGASGGTFAWTEAATDEAKEGVLRAARHWLSDDVRPLVKGAANAVVALERANGLLEADLLMSCTPAKQRLLPWDRWDNGTTKPPDWDAYAALADSVARALEGHTLFEGLPPLRRVVSRYARTSNSEAELITAPILDIAREPFSLVLRVVIASLPGVPQPLVNLDVSKRRWTSHPQPQPFDRSHLSGYAFPANLPIVVRFQFDVGKDDRYHPGHDYHAIQRRFKLKGGLDGLEIAGGGADSAACELRVTFRNGYGRPHPVKSGVPEIDKLRAYENACEVLNPLGLRPWTSVEQVKTKHKKPSGGRVNVDVLRSELGLQEDGDEELDVDKLAKKLAEAGEIVERTREALSRYHPGNPLLVIAYYDSCRDDAELAARLIRYLTGGDLEVALTPVPDHTHGHRRALPLGEERNAVRRGQARLEAWRSLTDPLRDLAQKHDVVGCLVLAPKFFSTKDGIRRDDTVNKAAGRRAIASRAGVPVQYLLPREDDLSGFLTRTQSAWQDLAWAHQGRVDGVAERIRRLFPTENAPTEVVGISFVQRNKKRAGLEGSLVPVAFKLDVEEGRCLVRFAYEDKRDELAVTDWEPIRVALSRVAGLSPLTLGKVSPNTSPGRVRELRRQRFESFCEEIISGECAAGARPLVLINSTHAAQYWGWLKDSEIDSADIDTKTAGVSLQARWPGVRIVRIREDNSPRVVKDKSLPIARLRKDDARARGGIQQETEHRVPTPPGGDLYRVEEGALPTYLTVGGKRLIDHKRGLSSYRSVTLLKTKTPKYAREFVVTEGGIEIGPLKTYGAFIKQWPAPNAVELVVAFSQPGDAPDSIAEFVEGLRYGYGHYGEWSSLPAPLFFERVVRDYIAEFSDKDEED